jgi:hypothetical protein
VYTGHPYVDVNNSDGFGFFLTLGLDAKVKNLVSSVSIHIRIDHANEDSKKTETNTVRPGMRR